MAFPSKSYSPGEKINYVDENYLLSRFHIYIDSELDTRFSDHNSLSTCKFSIKICFFI